MNQRANDVVVLIIITISATLVTFVFTPAFIVSVILFFGLPAAYLALKNPGILRKSLAFAVLMSIPLSLFIDTIAAVNGSWVITHSIFPFKIFGAATMEVYIYGLLWVLYAVLFYEHVFDEGKKDDDISPRIQFLIFLALVMVFYTVIGYYFNHDLLHVPRFYLLVGILFVILPLGLFLHRYPRFITRYLLLGAYFFVVMFAFEIAALQANQWIFSAQDFLGYVAPFGYRFPVEELVIWMVAATASLLSYYEFFADDKML